MKKLFLFLAVMLFVGIQAQTTDQDSAPSGQNDVMIDPLMLIALPAANISYERLINQDSGIGINGIFGLGRDFDGFSQFSPYYRMYFGKKYAAGFFLEGFVPISTITTETYYYNTNTSKTDKATSVGLGIGFGGKWIAKKNIVFEASGGIARRFGNTDEFDIPVTFKGMLGIGYRF